MGQICCYLKNKCTGLQKGCETDVNTPYSHWGSGMASKGERVRSGHFTHHINKYHYGGKFEQIIRRPLPGVPWFHLGSPTFNPGYSNLCWTRLFSTWLKLWQE